MAERRKDSKKRVLKEGEYQRSNGTYEYRWRSENGKRNNVYAKSLEELREKEAEIQRDRRPAEAVDELLEKQREVQSLASHHYRDGGMWSPCW